MNAFKKIAVVVVFGVVTQQTFMVLTKDGTLPLAKLKTTLLTIKHTVKSRLAKAVSADEAISNADKIISEATSPVTPAVVTQAVGITVGAEQIEEAKPSRTKMVVQTAGWYDLAKRMNLQHQAFSEQLVQQEKRKQETINEYLH